MDLHIDINVVDNIFNIKLAGEIDVYSAPNLQEELEPLAKRENIEIVVDLADVSYMDSTGIGIFIGALKYAKENNTQLTLVNLQKRVSRLFEITGVDEVINIKQTSRGEQ